jgi:hypothetical protein
MKESFARAFDGAVSSIGYPDGEEGGWRRGVKNSF